ncbi:MAG: transposase [Endomicrobiales bacterium]|nr:transposase [Endomicrobiales bacterium]
MSRPLRISYEGAIYHITARGNEKRDIFIEDYDRIYFLKLLEKCIHHFKWICHAYCLMDNHYHFIMEITRTNISEGMRQLNGVYTQYFNHKYNRVGHLFQGRFKGILVQKDSHLLELCRYVVINPVRAKKCKKASDYTWSSYRAMVGLEKKPSFLCTDWILSQFSESRSKAEKFYSAFVDEGLQDTPWDRLKGQIYYGSDEFILKICKGLDKLKEIPVLHTTPVRPSLSEIVSKPRGVLIANKEHGYKLTEIAKHLGVHYSTVSRRIREMEKNG